MLLASRFEKELPVTEQLSTKTINQNKNKKKTFFELIVLSA